MYVCAPQYMRCPLTPEEEVGSPGAAMWVLETKYCMNKRSVLLATSLRQRLLAEPGAKQSGSAFGSSVCHPSAGVTSVDHHTCLLSTELSFQPNVLLCPLEDMVS